MKELMEGTGIASFSKESKLTSGQLNLINNKINELVDNMNSDVLEAYFNLNKEAGDPNKTWTLEQAIAAIPTSRRALGIQLRFLEDNSGSPAWIDYIFIGETLDNFNNTDFWITGNFDIIDGGEW
jgi:hypothetical protein